MSAAAFPVIDRFWRMEGTRNPVELMWQTCMDNNVPFRNTLSLLNPKEKLNMVWNAAFPEKGKEKEKEEGQSC